MRYVYGDLFWLLNFGLNYLLLYLTGILSESRAHWFRLLLASGLGATYSLALLYPSGSFLLSASLIGLFSLIMLAVAFRPGSVAVLLRQAAWFYGLAFIAAGASMALGWQMAGPGGGFSSPALIGGAVAMSVLATTVAVRLRRGQPARGVVLLKIGVNGQVCRLEALVDTGNRLKDPFTGWPVVVAETDALAGLLPGHLLEAARDPLNTGPLDEESGSEWKRRLRLIPYSSLGKSDGVLFAVRPDWLSIGEGMDKQEIRQVAVALSPSPLTEDGSYRALLPGDLWPSQDQGRDDW